MLRHHATFPARYPPCSSLALLSRSRVLLWVLFAMPVLVSLVIPIYNRERYLNTTIRSVLAQTYPHFELVLWDDRSTDASLQIAQHYATLDSRIRVVAATHQGLALSLKSAFALTTGTYIGWIDSDDYLAPTALAETVAILDTHPEVGLVYTDYQQVDEHGQHLGLGDRCAIPYSKERLLLDFMVFHFRLMHRSAFEQGGGIDPQGGIVADYDIALRLSEVTQFYHLPRPLYSYRVHAESMSQQRQRETIAASQAAVERALQRRGLSDRFELGVELTQTETHLSSRFTIREKLPG